MYHFSRSIYRELAARHPRGSPGEGPTNHERVLRSCETCVERLATDWHYFAKPDEDAVQRHPDLFPDVGPAARLQVVDRYMTFAREYFAANPTQERLECRATTRRGTPCQRTPLPHNGYCPSHQHLAETED